MSKKEDNPMRSSRLTVTFLACLLMPYACAQLLEGVHAESLQTALMVGAALGVAYLLVRPVLRLVTLPIGCLTLGVSNFVIDVAILYLLALRLEGFAIDSVVYAAIAAAAVDAVVLIVGGWR